MWKNSHHLFPLSRESLLKHILIEFSALSLLFSSTMEGFLGMQERLSSTETSLRPKFLYSDLVGDMH
jgi:hypothetical protein